MSASTNENQSQRAYGYPVEWSDSPFEESLWGSEASRHAVMELLRGLARVHARACVLNESDENASFPPIGFSVTCDGTPTVEIATQDDRLHVLCSRIHSAIRCYRRENVAILVRQVDVCSDTGKPMRLIVMRRDRQRPVSVQLRALERAIQSKSTHRIEAAWLGLTPGAYDYLSVGFEVARRRRLLHGFTNVDESPGTLLSRPIPNSEFLGLILPFARQAAAQTGRRPEYARDVVLAALLDLFLEVTGRANPATCCGGFYGPHGEGADFIRKIESIFGLKIMPENSAHALRRARRLMAGKRSISRRATN